MKHRKVTLSEVLLWGVVAYALALLTYCTMKSVLSTSADNISAFGSILGASGAFFAAFVATYLFNDWRLQASFDLKKQHVNEISYLLAQSYDELHKMEEILLNLKNVEDYKILSEKYYSFKANDLRDEFYSKQLNVKILDRLNKSGNEIFDIYAKYQNHFVYLVDNFNRIQKSYIRYYDKFNSTMSNAERLIMQHKESFPKYILSEKNIDEVGYLNTHIYFPIRFEKENISYKFNNIFELINKISEIYKDLETKVLDSIDLTKND
ncbi:hypothetical protein OHV36_01245 [Acinetobacter baumannii]|nr:hypothetical protein [Acinetobacter baumannii]